jgi:hypothetical protein
MSCIHDRRPNSAYVPPRKCGQDFRARAFALGRTRVRHNATLGVLVMLLVRNALPTLLLISIVGCEQKRQPERHEFPTGIASCAVVVWGEPGHPELPIEDGKRVLRFPEDGILVTSTKQDFGWALDESFFVDEAGHPTGRAQVECGTTGVRSSHGITMSYTTYSIASGVPRTSSTPCDTKVEEAFRRLHPTPN